ncbi:MAG: hypothetical protein JWO53_1346, partial [Chlamydiia bacterium]|nr:hypothetical protein [Chlamydiia bacterium]
GYGLIYSICCPPAAMNSTDQIGLLATFVITALVSIPHLLLLFVPGDKGPNRFGDETTDGYTVTL